MKKTVKAYIHYSTVKYSPGFEAWSMKMTGSDDLHFIAAVDVEFDVPDDFDPRPGQIAALKEKQTKAAAAFHAMNTEIMRQISELEAICFDEVTA